jgi:hypothetical protein
VARATDLTLREVTEALRRLSRGGLVTPAPPLVAQVHAFKTRLAAPPVTR